VLDEKFPAIAEGQPELLAYHFTEASQDEAAICYWHRAGQYALHRTAYAEALVHLRQGLAVLATQPETHTNLQQELDLQVALSHALHATKGQAASRDGDNCRQRSKLAIKGSVWPNLNPIQHHS
jgi:predicted ATPase